MSNNGREERRLAVVAAEREMRKATVRALDIPTKRVDSRPKPHWTKRYALATKATFEEGPGRIVVVVATTGEVDRCGDIVVPNGASLDRYRQNPVVLMHHDPEQPVANCVSIGRKGDKIVATIKFPPAGTSALSDEAYNLVKAGVLGAVSIGFEPTKMEPIDPLNPRGGIRYLAWELMEISFVSIPANASALVIQRTLPHLAQRKQPTAGPKGFLDIVRANLPDKGFGGFLRGVADVKRR